jgi:diguanylate cyclase (GGDEF)-like protein
MTDDLGRTDENASVHGTAPRRRALGAISPEWWLQGLIAASVIACGFSDFLVHRGPSGYNTIWDGWIYNIAQSLPVIPMLIRVRRTPELRSAWLAMAAGVTLNSLGNLLYTFHDQNLRPIPDPAPSDALYLLSYVAFIVGVLLSTQSSFGRLHASVRLDGAITGLAIGAVAGVLWFGPVLQVSGHPLQVAVEMAYPVGDLVLIVLLVAGLAPHRYRPDWPTALLMMGVLWFVIGDVVSMDQIAANTYVTGTLLDETWPVGLFCMGLAASLGRRPDGGTPSASSRTPGGITVVPVVFGLVSLAVIAADLHKRYSVVVMLMAIGALVLVIGRMWLTLREVRHSAENYQDARTDYLTGLPNRRAFLERAQSAFPLGQGSGGGVLLIDLDGFKEVNDALGHVVGDLLLCAVAKRFAGRLGSRGTLARVGGDEYACALPAVAEPELVAVGHELSQALSDPFVLDGVSVRIGASIGVAMRRSLELTAGELLRSADVAMYAAKQAQAELAVYKTADDPNSRERLALLDSLRDAIGLRSFIIHYQPTLDMRTGAVHGVEALVRWPHPDLGLLYPDSFIPLAERAGIMPRLTRVVLEQAVAEAARFNLSGRPLQLSVNISRYDLVDEGLADYVDNLLALHGLRHDLLTLEITESGLGGDPERAARSVRELRARGLRISIDDYGVGYSSMSRLLEMPIDELKIDKSFVFALISDDRAEAIVRSAIALARALGITVVAEGIESEEVLRLLRSLGTDIGQGYFISRPLAPVQLYEYLADRGTTRLDLPTPACSPSAAESRVALGR